MSEVTAYLYNCTPVKPDSTNITWSLRRAEQEITQGLYNRTPNGEFPLIGRIYENKADAENARAKAGVDFAIFEIKTDTIGSYSDPNHQGVVFLEIPKDKLPEFVRLINGHGTFAINMDEQGVYKIAPVSHIAQQENVQVASRQTAVREAAVAATTGGFFKPKTILERAQKGQSKEEAEPPRHGPAPAA